MTEVKSKKFRNPTGSVEYRGYTVIIHEFEEGDFYCSDQYYFQIVKPDGLPYWKGDYISGGYEQLHRGLHQMFDYINRDSCTYETHIY